MAVRLLHLADLHLGSQHDYLGEGAESRARDIKETFRQAINFALDPENSIGGVVIAGNLFDQHAPDPETLSFVRGLLGRLVAARTPVVLVPGYRDAVGYRDSVFRTDRWPGVDVLTAPAPGARVTHEIQGQPVEFYGVAVQPGAHQSRFAGFIAPPTAEAPAVEMEAEATEEEELSLEVEPIANSPEERPIRVGILCAGMGDHPESGLRSHLMTVEPTVLSESGMDYVALGGFHEFTSARLGETLAVWPGTLEGRRFEQGDLGPKSLVVAEVSRGNARVDTFPFGSAHLDDSSIDLLSERITDPDALMAAILARAGDKVIARLHITGPMEFLCDLDEIAEKLAPRFRHLEIIDETDLLHSGLLRRIEGEHTIRGFFVRKLLTRIHELESRAQDADAEALVHRELRVARRALKLGLEQFLEEEPTRDILAKPSEAPTDRQGMSPLVKPAIAEPKTQTASRNGKESREGPISRAKALLRSERAETAEGGAS